jgi:uncharacterized protein YjbI with pentapeptide repeats
MKSHSLLAIIRTSFFVACLMFLSGAFATATVGQAPQNNKTALPPEEQELIKARRANEEAQAEYYRQQTNKLREPPPSVKASPGKTFSQSVAENPASVVGVVGTILGALIVAIVGLTTLYFNNRNAIKAQKDTQFYEAMKRLGDKDNPTIRASAAGLLALMAQVEWPELSLGKHWPPLKRVRSRPYFMTALDQLLTELLLENTSVVIEPVKDALHQLLPLAPPNITHRLYDANLRIQDELSSLMAEFFIVRRSETKPDDDEQERQRELWKQLENSTGYSYRELLGLVTEGQSVKQSFEDYLRIFRTQTTGDRGQAVSANHKSLRVASSRLRANVSLFCTALQSFRPQDPAGVSFKDSFLVGGSFVPGADLSGLDFSGSILTGLSLSDVNMTGTNLGGAFFRVHMNSGSLRGAFLMGADLQFAWLHDVDMSDARLANVKIDEWSFFQDCNLWKADFYTSNPIPEVDSDLLEKLYETYQKDIPADLGQVHESVRMFLEGRGATSEPKPAP